MPNDIVYENLLGAMPSPEVLVNGEPYYLQLLEVAKEEIGEMSKDQGELMYVGTLAEILGAENFEGSVSLARRIESGEITTEQVDHAVSLLEEAYVTTSKGAPLRCVDGRSKLDYDDSDPASYGEPLGPQVQGATIDEAAAKRLDRGYEPGATLEADVRQEAETDSEFTAGSHDDDHSPEGCGAVKGQEKKLSYYEDPKKFIAIKKGVATLAAIAGSKLPENALDHLPANAQALQENAPAYYGDKVKAVNVVTEYNPAGKITVEGSHNEAILAINLVPNTTLHTSHFNVLTDGKIEAFGLDAWRIENQAIVADALATVMNLTDGTIRVYIRLPREKATDRFEPTLEKAIA